VRPVVNIDPSEAMASTASAAVEDISEPKTDPFHSLDSGIDASRDLTTGESVLFIQSELNNDLLLKSGLPIELPLISSVDTQISNSSIPPTDVMPVGVTFDTVPSVVEVPLELSTQYAAVKIKKILGHTGLPQKSSKLYFNVEWDSGDITWKKYSSVKGTEALDAYIILNPALAILTSSVPAEAPKEFIPHQHGTRFQLRSRLKANLEALQTGVYSLDGCVSEKGTGMVYHTLSPEELLEGLRVPGVSCALPSTQFYGPKAPSSKTRKRGAKYGTQRVTKLTRASVPTYSRRALLAAQELDEKTRPSRKALVAAQLVEDEATYDPLL
jgi:hypothetical protein